MILANHFRLFCCWTHRWQSRAFPFHERETEHWLKEEWPHSLLHHNSSTSQQWENQNGSLHRDCLPCQTHWGIFLTVFHCQSRNLIRHTSQPAGTGPCQRRWEDETQAVSQVLRRRQEKLISPCVLITGQKGSQQHHVCRVQEMDTNCKQLLCF